MHKLLLTLVTLSTGVLYSAGRNLPDSVHLSLDQMKIMNSHESNATAVQQFHKVMKRCTSHLQRDDYVVTKGMGAHKLNKRKVKWDEARKACIAEGGLLAIINSVQEATMLVEWMNRENVGTAWLGIHDQFTEGEWMTVTGGTLDSTGYNRWTTKWPNQPDNYRGQNCGVLISDGGGLDDERCNRSFYYFCKIYIC